MDSVVALAAMSADLKTSRVHSITARIASNNPPSSAMSGGYLAAEATVKLGQSSAGEEAISSVLLKVEGFPKGVEREKASEEDRVFCIEVEVQGVYGWRKSPSKAVLGNKDLAHALGRPMYTIAASEVRAIAVKMGFMGVYIDADLLRANNEIANAKPLEIPHAAKPSIDAVTKEAAPRKRVAAKRGTNVR